MIAGVDKDAMMRSQQQALQVYIQIHLKSRYANDGLVRQILSLPSET